LREAARALSVRAGLDVIVGAKKSCAEAPFGDLKAALASALRRADALDGGLSGEERS
jgi:RNase P protein component